ncbi:MAG: hypothetical protein H0X39_20610 [Actinobacteria bacterium]|nr:hypothetical protein [Actinomycetota bacterium]
MTDSRQLHCLGRVGVHGAGNVGSALLMEMAANGIGRHVEVASRRPGTVEAALLDVASAYPARAANFEKVEQLKGVYDVIVLTSGIQPSRETAKQEMLKINLDIAMGVADSFIPAKNSAVVIVGSPVDELSQEFLHARHDLLPRQVVGFGGELDRARLRTELLRRGIPDNECTVVGEHGSRTVPVYDSEEDYENVARGVRSSLDRIKSATGQARNLASGVQICHLLSALDNKSDVQCVSQYDERHGIFLTWPYRVGPGAALERVPVSLGPAADKELGALVEARLESARGRI